MELLNLKKKRKKSHMKNIKKHSLSLSLKLSPSLSHTYYLAFSKKIKSNSNSFFQTSPFSEPKNTFHHPGL